MKTFKVPREFWAFDEVRAALGISERDLKRMVMDGAIRPVSMFSRPLHLVTMEGEVPVSVSEEVVAFHGWLFAAQEQAEQFDNFNCLYRLWRNSPFHADGVAYYSLPDPMTLDQLLALSVVLDEHVQRLLSAQREDPDRDLSAREEKTRDKLIAGFAAEMFKWQGGDLTFKGLTEFCDALNAIEIGVSPNTVKEHVELAWTRAKPKSLAGKPALKVA